MADPPHQLHECTDALGAADAAEKHERQPCGGAAAAAAAATPVPFVSACWEQGVDLNSGAPYWFNRATGASQWHPPPGWVLPAGSSQQQAAAGGGEEAISEQQQHQQQHQQHQHSAATDEHPVDGVQAPAGVLSPAAAAAGEAGSAQPPTAQPPQQPPQQQHLNPPPACWEPGLYYRDAYGQLQGPFTLEQLRQWRSMLPMDLPVARLGPAGSGGRQQTAACAGSDAGGGPGGGGPGGSAQLEAGGWGSWEQLELAGLLGDEGLLDRWRMDNSEQARVGRRCKGTGRVRSCVPCCPAAGLARCPLVPALAPA